MATIKFVVDGEPVSVNADPKMPLLYALRDDLKLKKSAFRLRCRAVRRLHRALVA